MQQHAMIGGHLREFLVLVAGGETKHKVRAAGQKKMKINYGKKNVKRVSGMRRRRITGGKMLKAKEIDILI